MKKLLVGLSILCILLVMTSCKQETEEDILCDMKKFIDDFNNYECVSNVVVKSNKGESVYKFNETFIKPDKFKLEIIEPKESLGCIIIYSGDKVFLKHPNINQTISIDNMKSLDKNFFLANFYKNLNLCESPSIDKEEIKGKEYIIFTIDLPEKTDYRCKQKIWINKKDFVPYKLNILDKNEKVNTEVFYEKFNYEVMLEEDI